MRAVGVKELKNRLSEYLRLVASGELVLVTDHDRVVAEMSLPRAGRTETVQDARLADLVEKGWLTPPLQVASSPPPSKPVAPLKQILRELAQDREER